MSLYADIIERLTEATGPDRELDAAIIVAATPAEGQGDDLITLRRTSKSDECAPGTYWRVSFSGKSLHTAELYTYSLDAAVALAERFAHPHGRKLICFFCAGGQLTPENAVEGSDDYHPLAKIDTSVTVGWMAHVAFLKSGSGETFGPEGYSHGKTPAIAILLALFRALQAREESKPTKPSPREDWHYDSDGYCDNPGRGY